MTPYSKKQQLGKRKRTARSWGRPKTRVAMKRCAMKKRGKRGAMYPKRKNREFRRWLVREKPCLLAGKFTLERVCPDDKQLPPATSLTTRLWRHVCWTPRDPAHVGVTQAKGAGDVGSCVVLCRPAHRLYDTDRPRFHRVTKISEREMEREAGGYGLAWIERGGKITDTEAA